MKTAVLLPDGIGLRNFVLGPFLDEMLEAGPVHCFHMVDDQVLNTYASRYSKSVEWHRMVELVDRPYTFVLRRALGAAQQYWIDTPPMRAALDVPLHGFSAYENAIRVGKVLGRICATPQRMGWLERRHSAAMAKTPQVAEYRKLFERIKPDVVFCSHQRPPLAVYPVIAAKQLGIPTATFIFSWDNLSSKGRISVPFDHFLLWSDHMKKELFRFYPEVPAENAHVVGTPQFDPYGDPALLWSREEFCQRIGADPSRPLICYSGGDEETSKADQHHVRVLMELIRSGAVQGNPSVVVRPAPIDKGKRYADLRRDYPELIFAQPQWLFGKVEGLTDYMMPKPEDVQFLANITHHSDLNVNFASTMTLDFAIHDKPVINTLFELPGLNLYPTTMWDFVNGFEHYRPVFELGAAKRAMSREEFASQVNAYLSNPALDREGRRKFVELEIGAPIGQSSRIIRETLQRIAGVYSQPAAAPDEPVFAASK